MKKTTIILTAIILFGCSARTSMSGEEGNSMVTANKTKQENNLVTFKVGQQQVNTSGWTISRFSFSNDPGKIWLNITTNMHEEKEAINVNLNGCSPGTYYFNGNGSTQGGSHGSYYPDYMGDIANSYEFKNGSFTITSIDTLQRTVNAVFKAVVENNRGEVFEITDGKISNGLLNMGIITY